MSFKNFILYEKVSFLSKNSKLSRIATVLLIPFEKIKLNRIFNFSDFVFLNNSFPISFTKNKINFVKITNIKQKLQLTYYDFDSTGSVKKTNVDEFQDIPEGINYLKEVFDGVPKEILLKNNFLVESDSEK